ncbi:manganese efflux pump MntP family protein [Ruminococcaceae bacterium OttesenSCG-928-L11]|nr:manganese efflux pump MntP family protein [Ruminococcaceae bacterium OttesenSCG-928-L11]
MSLLELALIAVGLSMDAFAVAMCKGLSMRKSSPRQMLIVGLYFGGFQAAMPLLGYFLGSRFAVYITALDHWMAFVLLGVIGGKMIAEGLSHRGEEAECATESDASLKLRDMLPLAVATSIDALAVGITFAFLYVDIVPAVTFIGVVTLVLSMVGVKLGNLAGSKFQSKAELAGGVILVLMGVKILLEHMGLLG